MRPGGPRRSVFLNRFFLFYPDHSATSQILTNLMLHFAASGEDQPADPTIRLMVRPGITGWAQVNGGKQITNDEKGDLDEWYIRNASPWLELAHPPTHLSARFCRRPGEDASQNRRKVGRENR